MAIHVRATNAVKRKISSAISRMLTMALAFAMLCILMSAFLLYFMKIYLESQGSSSFVTYTPPPEKPTTRPQKKKMEESASEASSNASAPSPVIIATTSPFNVDIPTDVSNFGEGADGDDTLAGFGLGGDGLGNGLGLGNGFDPGIGEGADDGIGEERGEIPTDDIARDRGRRGGSNDDIQIVLLVDASGSMEPLFKALSACMKDVMSALNKATLNGKKAKINVGLAIYGFGDSENIPPKKLCSFTTSAGSLSSKLDKTVCSGGIECCGDTIDYALREFRWNKRNRDNLLKVIFIAGNESFNQGKTDPQSIIAIATEQNMFVNTIHCGGTNQEWEKAALLGNGVGLAFIPDNEMEQKEVDKALHNILTQLYKIEPLPTGSPTVQTRHLKMLRKTTPPSKNAQALQRWLRQNHQLIFQGFHWDAIEIYRKAEPGTFTIDMLGGKGNIPICYRNKSENELISYLQTAAQRRTELLNQYQQLKTEANLGTKILHTLKQQAETKGILIEY